MSGFVVGMMIAASLVSSGSFMGGPGLSYNVGGSFVLVSYSIILINFSVLTQVGKKVGIVARRINAHSFLQLLTHRFNNNKVVGITGLLAMIAFLSSIAIAQFIGGARLFEVMTGLPYWVGLLLFSLVVIFIAALGGIRGVSTAIAFQGIVMSLAVIFLLFATISYLGPLQPVFENIALNSPNPAFITPSLFAIRNQISLWILFGVAVVAYPHGVMGTLVYKNTRSLHNAIKVGMVVLLIWQICLATLGFLARGVLPALAVADYAIPALAMKVLPTTLAGITLAGVSGAIQSTVAAVFLIMSSAIVKDAYQTYINPKAENVTMKKVTLASLVVISLVVFAAALFPPPQLQYLIMFASGGLAAAFLWPLLLGLYWMRCNEYGAVAGMIGGMATYLVAQRNILNIKMGMDPIVIAIIVSGILVIGVSMLTPKTPKGIIQIWFGKIPPKVV